MSRQRWMKPSVGILCRYPLQIAGFRKYLSKKHIVSPYMLLCLNEVLHIGAYSLWLVHEPLGLHEVCLMGTVSKWSVHGSQRISPCGSRWQMVSPCVPGSPRSSPHGRSCSPASSPPSIPPLPPPPSPSGSPSRSTSETK